MMTTKKATKSLSVPQTAEKELDKSTVKKIMRQAVRDTARRISEQVRAMAQHETGQL
jgi:histone H3/H4